MDVIVGADGRRGKGGWLAGGRPTATEELKEARKCAARRTRSTKSTCFPTGYTSRAGTSKRAPRGTRTRRRATTTTPRRRRRRAKKIRRRRAGTNTSLLLGEGVVKGSTFVEQTLGMGNERFMVPEVLFHPSDIGLNQAGIAEAAAQAVRSVQSDLRGMLFANVVLAGGCALFRGSRNASRRSSDRSFPRKTSWW